MKNDQSVVSINKWFGIFATIHVLFWSAVPFLVRFTLPVDALEGSIWGRYFALGYDKNPFMNAWLTRLALTLGHSGWAIYLFGQLFVAICFWAVFQLGKKILSPVHALISVVLLEFISSYNIDSIDFDDNILELGFWALTIYFFYNALKKQKILDWFLVGLFAACSLMTKYYAPVLFLPMFLFLVFNKENWMSFKKPGLYIAILTCVLLSAPHFIWLFFHDFVTLKYAFVRVSGDFSWVYHFIYPWTFTKPMLEALIFPLVIFGTLYIGKNSGKIISEKREVTRYQWQFLCWMGFGPFFITVLMSLIGGISLHAAWGQPLLSLWGIILVAFFQPIITVRKFYRFMAIVFILLALGLSFYVYSLMKPGCTSSANYPGEVMANELTNTWHQQYQTKLSYVIGSRWEANNIGFYSKDRPEVFINANKEVSFWINENDLKRKGALLIWDANKSFDQQFVKLFPHMKNSEIKTFYYLRSHGKKSIKVGIAFLPPKK